MKNSTGLKWVKFLSGNTCSKLAIASIDIFGGSIFNYEPVSTHWVKSENGYIRNITNAGFTKQTCVESDYIPICCISLLNTFFRQRIKNVKETYMR